MMMDPFGDFMFSFIPIMITIIFIFIFGFFVLIIVQGSRQWNKNNHSPVLTVPAKICGKRTSVSHHSHINHDDMGMHHSSSSTTYYITFEVESGDRIEFMMPTSEYGLLVEGDVGRLTFQGTRYKGFERDRTV